MYVHIQFLCLMFMGRSSAAGFLSHSSPQTARGGDMRVGSGWNIQGAELRETAKGPFGYEGSPVKTRASTGAGGQVLNSLSYHSEKYLLISPGKGDYSKFLR